MCLFSTISMTKDSSVVGVSKGGDSTFGTPRFSATKKNIYLTTFSVCKYLYKYHTCIKLSTPFLMLTTFFNYRS